MLPQVRFQPSSRDYFFAFAHCPLGFVEWAKIQIEQYAEMFRKQVFNSDVEKQMIEDCIEITQNTSKKA